MQGRRLVRSLPTMFMQRKVVKKPGELILEMMKREAAKALGAVKKTVQNVAGAAKRALSRLRRKSSG